MTGVRETRPRKKSPGRSRRRAEDAGLLDPLLPPDVFVPLATDRLVLRPLVPEDADALHRLVNDWRVARNQPWCRSLSQSWRTIGLVRAALARRQRRLQLATGREGDQEDMVRPEASSMGGDGRLDAGWDGVLRHGVACQAAGRGALGAPADLDRHEAGVSNNPHPPQCAHRIRGAGEGSAGSGPRRQHAVWQFEQRDNLGHSTGRRMWQADAASRRLC